MSFVTNRLALQNVLLASALCLLAAPSFAAVPGTSVLEGVLHATGGGPAADGDYKFTFSIYATKTGGAAAWTEKGVSLKVASGRFSYALGATAGIDAAKINGLGKAWLGIAVGADPELPRQRLHASIFAMHAKTAGGLACKGCVGKDALSNGSITSAKVQFAYALAADGIKGGAAADVKCTKCVSVSELKFDGDVDLNGKALKVGKLTASGNILAGGTIAAKEFIGDGSKLTGIKTPSGTCKAGHAVSGINADGTLKCVKAGLPADGLNEVSNDLLTNQFTDTFAAGEMKITDNNPSGIVSTINFPDIGVAQGIQVNVTIENSDIRDLTVFLFPPNAPVLPASRKAIIKNYPAKPSIDGTKYPHYLLHRKTGAKGGKIDTTYPAKTKPIAGDLHKDWIGKNPKGQWRLLVIDGNYLNNGTDGRVVKWSINLETLSNKKIGLQGSAFVKGTLWGADNGHGVAGGDVKVGAGLQLGNSVAKCSLTTLGSLRFHPRRGLEACTESSGKKLDGASTYHWTVAKTTPIMWSGGSKNHKSNHASWLRYYLNSEEFNTAQEYFDVDGDKGVITIKISGYYRLNFFTIQHGCNSKRVRVYVNGNQQHYSHNDQTCTSNGHRWNNQRADFTFPYKAGDTVYVDAHSATNNPYPYHSADSSHHSRLQFSYEGPLDTGGSKAKPMGTTCNNIKTRWPTVKDGMYWIDPDGASGKAVAMEVYCDMTTDGGGWTLAGWMPQNPNSGNLPSLRCGGGEWWDARTRVQEASLPSVELAKKSTQILFSRSDLYQQTGNIMAYDVVTKFPIPKPDKINFINHSQKAGHKGTGDKDRGPCVAVKIKWLKGPPLGTDTTRYTYQNVLGASWTDSNPSGYGAVDSATCDNTNNWSKGPFFISNHSGASATDANGCPSNGKKTYNHKNHWDPTGNNRTGSAAIWFK